MYLQRRDYSWYFRLPIPKALKAVYGKLTLSWPTGSSRQRGARRRSSDLGKTYVTMRFNHAKKLIFLFHGTCAPLAVSRIDTKFSTIYNRIG
jgi:hypothetical protein